jgi:branched-chain amino acid transport system substrate-binding protein
MFYKSLQLVVFGLFSNLIFFTHVARTEELANSDIKIGNVITITGEPSREEMLLRVAAAYFKWINDEGGVQGRMIKLISYNDEGELRKTLALTRKLVEIDRVALLFQINRKAEKALGPYVRFKNVPKIFDFEPADVTDAGITPPEVQGEMCGRYIVQTMPNAKVAILYEDNKFGVHALDGLWKGLGSENARRMVTNMFGSSAYSVNDVARVSGSSADVLVILGGESYLEKSLKQRAELTWHPVPVMTDAAMSLPKNFVPEGAVTSFNHWVPIRLTLEELTEWNAFSMARLSSEDSVSDFAVVGYLHARSLVSTIRSCGDNHSKECLINSYSAPDERLSLIRTVDVVRFNGQSWEVRGIIGQDPPGN